MFKSCRATVIATVIGLGGLLTVAQAEILGTEFTYQGDLRYQGAPANGEFDLRFSLYADADGFIQVAGPIEILDLTVSDGIFTTILDFGAGAFVGDALWLEVGVREGSSTAGYAQLLPRQKLTAAPNALHAEHALHAEIVSADAISSVEIADGSITGDDLAPQSVTSTSIAPGAVDGTQVDSSQVQLRVTGACAAGLSIQSIAADGSVTCEASGDSYTGILPVQVNGTEISLAPGTVSSTYIEPLTLTNSQIAPGAGIDPRKISGTAATLTGNQRFDGGTLFVDAADDEIGVGTTSPESKLDVRGDIQVDGDILLRTPRSGSVSVAGAAYTPTDIATEDDHLSTNEVGGYLYMGGNLSNPSDTAHLAGAIAPLSLPAGATVTRFTCHFYDATTVADLRGTAYLARRDVLATSGSTTIATVSLSTTGVSSTDMQSAFDDTISAPATIAATDTLWLYVRIDTADYSGTSLRFYGCTVDYTLDRLAP